MRLYHIEGKIGMRPNYFLSIRTRLNLLISNRNETESQNRNETESQNWDETESQNRNEQKGLRRYVHDLCKVHLSLLQKGDQKLIKVEFLVMNGPYVFRQQTISTHLTAHKVLWCYNLSRIYR
jgi:hypothetical protein